MAANKPHHPPPPPPAAILYKHCVQYISWDNEKLGTMATQFFSTPIPAQSQH